jgi:hypothetical protein
MKWLKKLKKKIFKNDIEYTWVNRYIYINNTHDFNPLDEIQFNKKVWLYLIIYKWLIVDIKGFLTFKDPVHEYHSNEPTKTGYLVQQNWKTTNNLKVRKVDLVTYEYPDYPNYYITNRFFIFKHNFTDRYGIYYFIHGVNFDEEDVLQIRGLEGGKDKIFNLTKLNNFYRFAITSQFIYQGYTIKSQKDNGTFRSFRFDASLDRFMVIVKVKNENIYRQPKGTEPLIGKDIQIPNLLTDL